MVNLLTSGHQVIPPEFRRAHLLHSAFLSGPTRFHSFLITMLLQDLVLHWLTPAVSHILKFIRYRPWIGLNRETGPTGLTRPDQCISVRSSVHPFSDFRSSVGPVLRTTGYYALLDRTDQRTGPNRPKHEPNISFRSSVRCFGLHLFSVRSGFGRSENLIPCLARHVLLFVEKSYTMKIICMC